LSRDVSSQRRSLVRTAIIFAAMVLGILGAAFSYRVLTDSYAPRSTPAAPAQNGYHFAGSADHVRIDGVIRVTGDEDQIVVTLTVEAGYHINANPASHDNLIPTTLTLSGPKMERVIYPKPVRFKAKFADDAIDVYQGTERIIAIFPKGALAADTRLRGILLVQACTDQICLPPAEIAVNE
jgi:hypothetical protein